MQSTNWIQVPYLPKIKSNGTNVVIFVQVGIWGVFWVINFRVDPFSFIIRVINLLWFPFSLFTNKIKKIINFCVKTNEIGCVCKLIFFIYKINTIKKIRKHGMSIPCTLGCQSGVAPILRPSHHPSRRVSWHLGQGCAQACPSPRVSCHQGHQSFHAHPSHRASWLLDPTVSI